MVLFISKEYLEYYGLRNTIFWGSLDLASERRIPDFEVERQFFTLQRGVNLKGESHEKVCEIMIWDVSFSPN
jgi:hypothetical protein